MTPRGSTGDRCLTRALFRWLLVRGVASGPHSYYKPMHVLECRMAGIQRAIGDYYETLMVD